MSCLRPVSNFMLSRLDSCRVFLWVTPALGLITNMETSSCAANISVLLN